MQTKVTEEEVKGFINTIEYTRMGEKTTVALARLVNGYEICVSSACVDPANYNEEIGQKLCRERVESKVWEYLGFMLQNHLFLKASSRCGADITTNILEDLENGHKEANGEKQSCQSSDCSKL